MPSHSQSLVDLIFKSLAALGTVINILSNIPRILKLHRIKDTRHVSTRAYIMNITGLTLITVYAFHFNLWEIFFPNIVMITQWIYILIIKYWFMRKYGILDQQLLQNEIEDKSQKNILKFPVIVDKDSSNSSDMDLSPISNRKMRL